MKLSVSLLGINSTEDIMKLNKTNTDYVHVDIMDGQFVDNTKDDYEKLLDFNTHNIDIHIMANEPLKFIDKYKKYNPVGITVHYEIDNLNSVINEIKSQGYKVGISIKPNTNIQDIYNLLSNIDLVLIMSVEPGYGGQKFIETSYNKIADLKNFINKNNLSTKISIDGGINYEIAKKCFSFGCDIAVVGSYITSKDNYSEVIENIKSI